MLVATVGTQLAQGVVQTQQVRAVQAAGAHGAVDVRGERGGVLGPGELVVVGRTNVDLGESSRELSVDLVSEEGGGVSSLALFLPFP